jgi:glycerophosphoryl diester phosphodiesterase
MPRAVAGLAAVATLLAAAPAAGAPLIHAHRGGSYVAGVPTYPENTMPGFRNAAREGYVLELDAKLTRDRVPVAFHDATLDRTTPCRGRIDEITLEQLKESCPVDVLGRPGIPLPTRPAMPTVPIPTVAEVLAFARREGAFVNLEIKNRTADPDFDRTPAFANRVMDVVLASGFPRSRLIIQSFWPPDLAIADSRMPGVPQSILTRFQENDVSPAGAAAARYEWVSPAWPVDQAFVSEAHGFGLRVVPYTLNTPANVRTAAGLGVDAVITDDPEMARVALGLGRRQLARDSIRPRLRLLAPSYASDSARGRRFRLRWRGTDRGSGIARYSLEVRRNTNVATRWRTVFRGTRRSVRFRGRPGVTYLFRLRARDRFGNLSRFDYGRTVVPRDDRFRGLRFSRGWRRLRSRLAYGRTLTRASRAGLTARVLFRGSRVALIARRSPRGGRLHVRVGGGERVISLRGRARDRQVVFRSRHLPPGLHVLELRTLGGRVDLDAIGVVTGAPAPGR